MSGREGECAAVVVSHKAAVAVIKSYSIKAYGVGIRFQQRLPLLVASLRPRMQFLSRVLSQPLRARSQRQACPRNNHKNQVSSLLVILCVSL